MAPGTLLIMECWTRAHPGAEKMPHAFKIPALDPSVSPPAFPLLLPVLFPLVSQLLLNVYLPLHRVLSFIFCSFRALFLRSQHDHLFFSFPSLPFLLFLILSLLLKRWSTIFSCYFLNIMIFLLHVHCKLINYVVAISANNYELMGKKQNP